MKKMCQLRSGCKTVVYGNPDNIIGESGTDGDGISIFNDLRTPPIEYSMEPGNRQPFSEYDIAVSAPGFVM